MQSLGLDVKVLSDDNQEIEILDSSEYDAVGSIDHFANEDSSDQENPSYEIPEQEEENLDREPEDVDDFDETLDLDEEFDEEF